MKVEKAKEEEQRHNAILRERMVIKNFAEKTVIPGTYFYDIFVSISLKFLFVLVFNIFS